MTEPASKDVPPATSFRRFDFHCHTYLTDGARSPTDMWSSARQLGHSALAITDHVGLNDPHPLLERLRQESLAWEGSDLITLVGVEVTHVPPKKIASAVRSARNAGAEIVIVHGETLAEPVSAGTNRAALETPEVDVLAHPGLLSVEDAERAKAQGTILEISAHGGHSLTNGHVLRMALQVGADLVVDSDAHDISQLIPAELARKIALGSGLSSDRLQQVLEETPLKLLRRCHKIA